ncbi:MULTISPECIES: hypothetical protein [Streptomyces]|nr:MULTISPECIES: hypothetical protein [Streptomyces]
MPARTPFPAGPELDARAAWRPLTAMGVLAAVVTIVVTVDTP